MIHYPKLIQIILNLTKIEALPKYIQNKSSEIQNLFSAEIPALWFTLRVYIIRCKIDKLKLHPGGRVFKHWLRGLGTWLVFIVFSTCSFRFLLTISIVSSFPN